MALLWTHIVRHGKQLESDRGAQRPQRRILHTARGRGGRAPPLRRRLPGTARPLPLRRAGERVRPLLPRTLGPARHHASDRQPVQSDGSPVRLRTPLGMGRAGRPAGARRTGRRGQRTRRRGPPPHGPGRHRRHQPAVQHPLVHHPQAGGMGRALLRHGAAPPGEGRVHRAVLPLRPPPGLDAGTAPWRSPRRTPPHRRSHATS